MLLFNDWVFGDFLYQYDADLGYRARPYSRWENDITNEFGFNDRDYSHQRTPGTYRILIIGDSFNWAGGLEGNYTAKLERKFEAEFGDQRVEVINMGYSATHTGEQLKALKKFGLQYRPDLVVLGFFVGNDFYDANPWRRRIVVGSGMVDLDTRRDWELNLFGQPLVLQSRLYLFLKTQWATFQMLQVQQQAQVSSQPHPQQPEVTDSPSQLISSQITPVGRFTYTQNNITEFHLDMEMRRIQIANWALATVAGSEFQLRERFAFDNILAMRDLLAENGIPFMVAAYPDSFQIDESLRQVIFTHYRLDPANYQLDRPQGRLWQFCTEQNIEFYDLLPAFQAAYQQGQQLYLPNDSHWNDAGNEVAAQYLFDVLIWKAREHLN